MAHDISVMELTRHKIEVTDDNAERYARTTGLAQALRRTENRDSRRHNRRTRKVR